MITDKKISSIQELLPILEQVVQEVIDYCRRYRRRGFDYPILNKLRGSLTTVAVKAPGFGDRREAMLQDIAILTGGQVITEKLGLELKNAKLEHLGKARQVKVDKDNTTIVEGAGSKKRNPSQNKGYQVQIEETTSDYDREKLQERLAQTRRRRCGYQCGRSDRS